MNTKLTDSQLVILSAACAHEDRAVFPVTGSLKGVALNKVLLSLIAKGLVEEVAAQADDTVWRDEDEGRLTLRATTAASAALGIQEQADMAIPASAASPSVLQAEPATPPPPAKASRGRKTAKGNRSPAEAAAADVSPSVANGFGKVREGTKQALVIEMLRRPEGATIDDIVAATGWQPHTVRGAMAGALKKKLGLEVTSEKVEGRGRVYRL
ncbi:MAG: DUF3489 domain-containing protein [Geminicoccaceae bacterium]